MRTDAAWNGASAAGGLSCHHAEQDVPEYGVEAGDLITSVCLTSSMHSLLVRTIPTQRSKRLLEDHAGDLVPVPGGMRQAIRSIPEHRIREGDIFFAPGFAGQDGGLTRRLTLGDLSSILQAQRPTRAPRLAAYS